MAARPVRAAVQAEPAVRVVPAGQEQPAVRGEPAARARLSSLRRLLRTAPTERRVLTALMEAWEGGAVPVPLVHSRPYRRRRLVVVD